MTPYSSATTGVVADLAPDGQRLRRMIKQTCKHKAISGSLRVVELAPHAHAEPRHRAELACFLFSLDTAMFRVPILMKACLEGLIVVLA